MTHPKSLKHGNTVTAQMFNAISPSYDVLNRLFSLGIDRYWRKAVCQFLPQTPFTVLDCATGTGDQLLTFLKHTPLITQAVGIDPAHQMLTKASHKLRRYQDKVSLKEAFAEDLPFTKGKFDVLSISFGIRNVNDLSQALKEMKRVLHPEGSLLILEFSHPTSKFLAPLYFFYLNRVLPFFGKLFSSHAYAYRYLAKTIATFPQGDALCHHLHQAGFNTVKQVPLSWGIVTLYVGKIH
ncbi:MAG: bifunctional demethylmenaquinone methyltransferase/2-methoxy-6-polyprenyl-1,4-benzoquinol methylase UbiE [Candidatus Rhabdochlamydia sp.]